MAPVDSTDNGATLGLMRAPLYVALGMCAGAALYYSLTFEPALGTLLTGCLVVLLAVWWGLRRWPMPPSARMAALLVCGSACGLICAKAHTDFRGPPYVTSTIGPVMLEGWISDIEPGQNGVRLVLDVHAVSGASSATLPRLVRLTHTNRLAVETGRFVRCWAVIRPPPQPELPGDYPFNRQAYFEGLDGVGYVMGRCRGGVLGVENDAAARIRNRVATTRRGLARHVKEAAGQRAGGFAAALTSGDRSFMPQADMEALRNSGLAHLLAISGLHLGIVGTLVFFAIKRGLSMWEWLALRVPTQKPAAASAMAATFLYMILSGASISTQRAFIMASVVFLAMILDRSPFSLRTFALAMIAVIIMQPSSVMTPGFQMSFAATGALIVTYEAWARRQAERGESGRRGTGFVLKSLAVTSIVGAVATAPFALYHFDRVAPLGLAANLLAMPIITFLSAPSAGLALVSLPFGLSDVFLRLFGWSLERVLAIAHWAAGDGAAGFSVGAQMPSVVLLILIAGLTAACLETNVLRRMASGAGACMAAVLVWAASPATIMHWSSSGDVYVSTDDGFQRLNFMDGEGLSPLQFADIPTSIDCGGQDGCKIESRAGTVLLGRTGWLKSQCQERAAIVISDRPISDSCWPGAVFSDWSDIKAGGAVSVKRSVGARLSAHRPRCGNRPWTPCLGDREDQS